jgi:hypothetical protein
MAQNNANQQQLKVSEFLPRNFNGTNASEARAHFLSFRDYLVIHHVNDANEAITRFRFTVTGKARRWLEGRNFQDVDDLERQFLTRFEGAPPEEADVETLTKLKMVAGESIEDYSFRVQELTQRLAIPARLTLGYFIQGLPAQMKLFVMGQNPNNIDAAIASANRYKAISTSASGENIPKVAFNLNSLQEDETLCETFTNMAIQKPNQQFSRGRSPKPTFGKMRRWRSPSTTGDESTSPPRRGRDERRLSKSDRGDPRYRRDSQSRSGRYRRSSRSQSRDRYSKDRRSRERSIDRRNRNESPKRTRLGCFVCGEETHFARECPDKRCYICDRKGHFAKDCMERVNMLNSMTQQRCCSHVCPTSTQSTIVNTDNNCKCQHSQQSQHF